MIKALLLNFFIFFTPLAIACDTVDDAGNEIHLNQPAKRIISLAPDITEILFAIGAGHRVIGVIKGSDFPRETVHIPEMGSYTGLDLERIFVAKPDLIVTWGTTFLRQLNVLKRMGVPIYVTQPKYLGDISNTMRHLGCLTGSMDKALVIAKAFDEKLARLRDQYQNKKTVSVFFQIGSYSLFTINQDSWINQIITLCGGKNIFAEAATPVPEVSWEAILKRHPLVVMSDAPLEKWQSHWKKWPMIEASALNLLFSIPPDLIDRAGPRLAEGAALLCRYLDQGRKIHPKGRELKHAIIV